MIGDGATDLEVRILNCIPGCRLLVDPHGQTDQNPPPSPASVFLSWLDNQEVLICLFAVGECNFGRLLLLKLIG
ncbi:unnamed protein product [Ilex paraguariensis]|uniref:Uncharacterized protein n=1 Tax=Ilex paraguariensis TaxID=185542 RepID=A0ABC8RXP6_9AQUA